LLLHFQTGSFPIGIAMPNTIAEDQALPGHAGKPG
jgi:hypothetical protein